MKSTFFSLLKTKKPVKIFFGRLTNSGNSYYLPLYIFFYFFLHIFFLHHFFQLDTGWTNLLKEPNTFASSFTLPPYWLLFRIQQKQCMEIFSSDLNDVMLIFVLTLHARTRKLYYYLMCRGMRRCD